MEEKGINKRSVMELLRKYKKQDMTHKSGRILGSMCTCPHEIGVKAYSMFLESNLGDPGLFKGTRIMEKEVITILGEFLGEKNTQGHIITGGTEANIMAMRAARNISNVMEPEIIVPRSAHFSFKKAADILCLKIREAELDNNYCVDVDSVLDLISEKTIAIVGIAGTTELGKIDPIEKLSHICQKRNIFLHVDAAFGGFSIPFLKDLGYDLPEFDFKLPGVCSITIDPHKMGLAPIPTGGILFRDKRYLDAMSIETPYLTEDSQSTIVGTRSGASAAATWALLKHLGWEGYQKIANKCMELTYILAQGVKEAGYNLVTEPQLNIVAFTGKDLTPWQISEMLEGKGWAVSVSSYPQAVRIIIMPHVKLDHINLFLDDLKDIND
jgi:tyrosine decarboxylase / aspartate 1-decarboxylase